MPLAELGTGTAGVWSALSRIGWWVMLPGEPLLDVSFEVVGMADASRTQLEQGKRAPRGSWHLTAAMSYALAVSGIDFTP